MRRVSAVAVLALAAVVAGCATSGPAYPPALLEYARRDCAAAPVLASAISLTPDRERAAYTVETLVDSGTPCLLKAGRPGPYLLYALPADRGDKTLIVGGRLEPGRIFSPHVTILDAGGGVSRTFANSDFMYRGAVYSVQFRPRENEVYVLVTSEPSRVGQVYNSILTGTQATPVVAGPVIFSLNSGTEAQISRTFSYDGRVSVLINDSDTTEERP